jgi:tetratricopeptide (TPR) repeat protein
MKKIIIILFSLIFIVGCSNSTDEINHFEVGQNYLESYEYDEAFNEFQAGILKKPSDEQNYLALAEIYSKKGDIDKSIDILNQGFNANASNKISNSLGQIYLTRGEFEESMKWFDSSLLKDPTDKDAMKGKIKLLSLTKNAEGLKAFLDSIDTASFDSELLIMKGVLTLEDTKEASRLILQSNTIDDVNMDLAVELRMALTAYESAQTVHNLSEIIYILLNYRWYEIAQTPVSKVLTDNQFYETAYVYQGLIDLHTSQYDKAIENFIKVRELNPNNVDAYIFQAQVSSLKNDEINAMLIIDEILAIENLQLTANQYSTIQQIYYDLGKLEEIEKLYLKYSEIIEIPASEKIKYVETMIKLGKFNQADLIIQGLVDTEGLSSAEKAKLKSFDAITSYKLDRKQEGMDKITEAENIDNTIAIIHYNKGLIMKDMGRAAEAQIAFERAVELDLQGNVTKLIQN